MSISLKLRFQFDIYNNPVFICNNTDEAPSYKTLSSIVQKNQRVGYDTFSPLITTQRESFVPLDLQVL
jgi:hypothetical protein